MHDLLVSESFVLYFAYVFFQFLKLILCCQELSKSKILAKSLKLASSKNQDLPAGYRSVRVKWKDLDKCNVCHMDEVRNCFHYLCSFFFSLCAIFGGLFYLFWCSCYILLVKLHLDNLYLFDFA